MDEQRAANGMGAATSPVEPVSPGHWLTESLDDGFRYSIHTHQVLSQANSPFQRVEVHQSDSFGRLLVLDGSFNVSEKDEFFYHENLVHVPACTHPRPATALIIGGGDGGAAEELLKHGCIQSVTLVEIDQAVIDVARTYLHSIHRGVIGEATGHPKLRVHIADGLDFINSGGDRYDLIILDLTDPGGPSLPLYTADFYEACAARLNSGGILALHVASPFAQQHRIASALAALASAFSIVRPYMVTVPLSGGPWMMACASNTLDPAMLSAAAVDARLATRGVSDLQFYNGGTHLAAMALPNFVRTAVSQTGARTR
jgi:spermidine synthase